MKYIAKIFIWVVIFVSIIIFYTYREIEIASDNLFYDTLDDVPIKNIGLLLGTSEYVSRGNKNIYFVNRINATVDLYKNRKIKKIIVSGDNSDINYNEPKAMQLALIESGVLEEDIVLDYAGFRTLDSVVRAKEIFEQDDIIVVSQEFHVRRAIYISKFKDIKMIGYVAKSPNLDYKIRFREVFSRVKAWLDINILNTQPKFLGDKIIIE